jgi:hypothetical protein
VRYRGYCAITFTVSNREKQKARTVRQQVWARGVELSDGNKEGRIVAACVVARELDPITVPNPSSGACWPIGR